jgi:hypothetical protein
MRDRPEVGFWAVEFRDNSETLPQAYLLPCSRKVAVPAGPPLSTYRRIHFGQLVKRFSTAQSGRAGWS